MSERKVFEVYASFEDENRAETERRATMSPEDRCRELAILQVRRWGRLWTSTPIEKVASWEVVDW